MQQQVRYTVKLYCSFGLTDGNLSEPQADGVVVQRLGQDKSYLSTLGDAPLSRDGTSLRADAGKERHARSCPRSCSVAMRSMRPIRPVSSAGRARSARAPMRCSSNVKPKPSSWPAAIRGCRRNRCCSKDDTELPGEIHVGDPVTRTIRLQAQGLGFEQLPELNLAAPEGAEIYPDKADTRTRDDGTWLYGERVRKFAFVPTKPGTLTIPGVRVQMVGYRARSHGNRGAARAHAERAAGGRRQADERERSRACGRRTDGCERTCRAATAPGRRPAQRRKFVRCHNGKRSQLVAYMADARGVGFVLWLITLALWWRSRRRRACRIGGFAAGAVGASAQRAAFLRACRSASSRALSARWSRGRAASDPMCAILANSLAACRMQRNAMRSRRCSARVTPARRRKASARSSSRAFKAGLAWRILLRRT